MTLLMLFFTALLVLFLQLLLWNAVIVLLVVGLCFSQSYRLTTVWSVSLMTGFWWGFWLVMISSLICLIFTYIRTVCRCSGKPTRPFFQRLMVCTFPYSTVVHLLYSSMTVWRIWGKIVRTAFTASYICTVIIGSSYNFRFRLFIGFVFHKG